MTLPPLALYAHFPWCVRKCPYCDFNSHTLRGRLPEQSYVEALIRDLQAQAQALAGTALRQCVPGRWNSEPVLSGCH